MLILSFISSPSEPLTPCGSVSHTSRRSSCQVLFFELLQDVTFQSRILFVTAAPEGCLKFCRLFCLLAALCSAAQLLAPCQELANTLLSKMGFQNAGLTSVSLISPARSGSSNLDWSLAFLLLQTGVLDFIWLSDCPQQNCWAEGSVAFPSVIAESWGRPCLFCFILMGGSVKKNENSRAKKLLRYQWHYKHLI